MSLLSGLSGLSGLCLAGLAAIHCLGFDSDFPSVRLPWHIDLEGVIVSTAKEESISWFPVPPEEQLPDNLQGLFRKARERMGFVPNVFRVYSFRPERLTAWFAHHKQLHEPTDNLSAAEREMIAVAVSMANRCLYCLVAHGAALRQALGDPVLADRITLDYRRAGLDQRLKAILDFAVKLTTTPHECLEGDINALRDTGLTTEEVWDVIEIAAMYNFTNRMAHATGMLPNVEYHALARQSKQSDNLSGATG